MIATAPTDPPNVRALSIALEPVRVAAIGPPCVRIDGSANEVWQCPAFAPDGETLVVYVKPALDVQRMVTEVLCAQVARALRLPCPEPLVVTVHPHLLGRPRGAPRVAFASRQAGPGPVVSIRSAPILLEQVRAAKLAELLLAFDELIGNAVRGPGDALLDPAGAGLILIDHERALELSVDPGATLTNWIADRLLENSPPARERVELLGRVRDRAKFVYSLELTSEPPSALTFDQNAPLSYTKKLAFLRERRDHLDRLLSERILPEQGYLRTTRR